MVFFLGAGGWWHCFTHSMTPKKYQKIIHQQQTAAQSATAHAPGLGGRSRPTATCSELTGKSTWWYRIAGTPWPTGTKFVFQFGSEKVTFPSLGPNHQPMGRFRLHVWQSGMLNRLQAPTKKGIIYPWFWRIHGGFKYIENDTFNMVVAFGLPSSGPNTLQSKLAGGDTIPNNRWFRFALWIWIPSFPGICFFYFDPHYWVTNIDPEYLLQAKSI